MVSRPLLEHIAGIFHFDDNPHPTAYLKMFQQIKANVQPI